MRQGSGECVGLLPCECGSSELCVCSTMPIFVYVSDRKIVRVVVADDEEWVSGGVARCMACDRFWVLDDKPDGGSWPTWEDGS